MKYGFCVLLILAAAFPVAAMATGPATARTDAPREWKISERLAMKEIHPGIWIHTSWRKLDNGIEFPSNGLLVRYDDALLLVDTAWGADLTAELLDWIDAELGLPVVRAVVTHFHDDRMSGTPVLVARGIPFTGLPLTRSLGKNAGVPLPAPIGDLRIGGTVAIGNVEVFYPGPGHSRDNLVVWVPEAALLFGGCAVRTPDFPGTGNTADADLANWPEAIRRVQQQYPNVRTVVPGHGPAGDASLLAHTIGLFEE